MIYLWWSELNPSCHDFGLTAGTRCDFGIQMNAVGKFATHFFLTICDFLTLAPIRMRTPLTRHKVCSKMLVLNSKSKIFRIRLS